MLLVFIMLGVLSKTNDPYVVNNILQTSGAWYSSPLHWFVAVAFFMILIVETGQLPVESHSTAELGMIDESMSFEYSGPEPALYKSHRSWVRWWQFVRTASGMLAARSGSTWPASGSTWCS